MSSVNFVYKLSSFSALLISGLVAQTTINSKQTVCNVPEVSEGVYLLDDQLLLARTSVLADSKITLQCNDGFTAISTNATRPLLAVSSICLESGQWSPLTTTHRCVVPAKTCNDKVAIEKGSIMAGSVLVGASRRIRCNPGFGLSGTSFITCQDNGAWTQPGQCIEIDCGDSPLPSIANGVVDLNQNGRPNMGATRNVNCQTGFVFNGATPTVKCQASGKWSLPSGKCDRTAPPASDVLAKQQQDLVDAAAQGNITTVKKLIAFTRSNGGYLNVDWRDGQIYFCTSLFQRNATALHRAVHCRNNTSSQDIATLLLMSGANVNSRESELGMTPLHYAARNGMTVAARVLLDKGADVNAKDNYGTTPLMAACDSGGNIETVQLLLDRGANGINAASTFGETALSIASVNNKADIVRVLLDNGADQPPWAAEI